MGKYFLMSMRFSKRDAEDFGLVKESNSNFAILPEDGSRWVKRQLYDFGWGQENGYCRLPLLNFDELIDLLLKNDNVEDSYGAAALIIDLHPLKLLEYCEKIISNKELERLLFINNYFHLDFPTNRCSTINKSFEQVLEDYKRWEHIARTISNHEHKETVPKTGDGSSVFDNSNN